MGSWPDLLNREQILSGLLTRWLGKSLILLDQVDSTNEAAKSIALQCENGTVILAETQTKGRGRLSRSWASPPGGVWMSIILRPRIKLSRAPRINMAVCVAVCRAITCLFGLEAAIKWPNDIMIGERKAGGILTEVGAGGEMLNYAVVGLGINANVEPSALADDWKATSLSQEIGSPISRRDLIQRILVELEAAYEDMESDEIYEEWRRLSATLGRAVRIASIAGDIEGVVVDLAEDGTILLKTREGQERVLAGDCIHLRSKEQCGAI